MNQIKNTTLISFLLAIIAFLIAMGVYLYQKERIDILPPPPPDTEMPTPLITSISPSSGPITTIVEIKGTHLAGFEGDLDAIIENSKGETAVLKGIGSVSREDQTIRVKIEAKLRTKDNSYSGLPCEAYLDIVPGVYKIYTYPWGKMSNKVQFTVTPSEMMSLVLYVQDKEIAQMSDCSATKKITYQVPKTTAFADASLKVLFSEELAQYGVYKSVTVKNGVAKLMLESDKDASGHPLGSLTSCQIGHLFGVLNDTLKQYPAIESVELSAPTGKIEF